MYTQELGVLGFSSLFAPSRNGIGPADTFDIVKLINSTYELLQQQQRNMKLRTDLEEKWVLGNKFISVWTCLLVRSADCDIPVTSVGNE